MKQDKQKYHDIALGIIYPWDQIIIYNDKILLNSI